MKNIILLWKSNDKDICTICIIRNSPCIQSKLSVVKNGCNNKSYLSNNKSYLSNNKSYLKAS